MFFFRASLNLIHSAIIPNILTVKDYDRGFMRLLALNKFNDTLLKLYLGHGLESA